MPMSGLTFQWGFIYKEINYCSSAFKQTRSFLCCYVTVLRTVLLQFYTIMNGMLMNESVYMPLLHFLIPFQLDGNNVVSEMWVDPDARRRSEEEGRKIKLFLKFDIQSLGKFELVMTLQDRESQIQLFVPTHLVKEGKQIQTDVSDILKRNGIRSGQLSIFGRVRDRKVTEVFPEIREKETTINVRI